MSFFIAFSNHVKIWRKLILKNLKATTFSFIFIISFLTVSFAGCDIFKNKSDENFKRNQKINLLTSLLTSARNLEGTWKTAIPVTIYTNVPCSKSCNVTFIIYPGLDNNHPNINIEIVGTSAGCSFPLDIYATGTISSTNLVVENIDWSWGVGNFNFTTDILTGTLDCTIDYGTEEHYWTNTNELILIRQ